MAQLFFRVPGDPQGTVRDPVVRSCTCSNTRTFSIDRCLVGKRGHQFDVLLRKRAYADPGQGENADRRPFSQHWHAQDRTKFPPSLGLVEGVFRIGQDIGDVDHMAFKQGSSARRPRIGLNGQVFE